MKFDDVVWAKWLRWHEAIYRDLSTTVNDRTVFRKLVSIQQRHPDWISAHHGGHFFDWAFRCYGAKTALGVRRHLKVSDDETSLRRLLEQFEKCAKQITFARYLKRFPLQEGRHRHWQPETFALLSEDRQTVSEAMVRGHLANLRNLGARVELWTDNVIAHLDRRGFDGVLTFTELDAVVDELDSLVCKYQQFLTGAQQGSLRASIAFPWQRIFSVPLIPPSKPGGE